MIIWYLFFIVLTFIQTTALPFHLLLVAVISFCVLLPSSKTMILLFWIGLLTDLVLMRPWGETSLFFLVLNFLIMLYGQKYQAQNPVFILIMTFLATLINNRLFLGVVLEQMIIIHLVLVLPVYFLMKTGSELLNRNSSQQLKLNI